MMNFKKPLSRFAHIVQIQHFHASSLVGANIDSFYIIGKNQTRKVYKQPLRKKKTLVSQKARTYNYI